MTVGDRLPERAVATRVYLTAPHKSRRSAASADGSRDSGGAAAAPGVPASISWTYVEISGWAPR
eukprot:10266746-Lingulodinium_polyedra.AAC.1